MVRTSAARRVGAVISHVGCGVFAVQVLRSLGTASGGVVGEGAVFRGDFTLPILVVVLSRAFAVFVGVAISVREVRASAKGAVLAGSAAPTILES